MKVDFGVFQMIRFPLALKGVPTDFPLEYRVLIPLFKKDGSYPYQRRGYYELEYIRDLDQTVVVIDLIYGLPYQTMEIWEDDIKTFLELELDGIDLYQLIIFKDKPLGKVIEEKRMIAADVAMQADMFARGVELMKKARYRRLSKSHWARTTRKEIFIILCYICPEVSAFLLDAALVAG